MALTEPVPRRFTSNSLMSCKHEHFHFHVHVKAGYNQIRCGLCPLKIQEGMGWIVGHLGKVSRGKIRVSEKEGVGKDLRCYMAFKLEKQHKATPSNVSIPDTTDAIIPAPINQCVHTSCTYQHTGSFLYN